VKRENIPESFYVTCNKQFHETAIYYIGTLTSTGQKLHDQKMTDQMARVKNPGSKMTGREISYTHEDSDVASAKAARFKRD